MPASGHDVDAALLGCLPARAEWDDIVGACREVGAYLFSDEMYRNLEAKPEDRLVSACEAYEKGVTLSGDSQNPSPLAVLMSLAHSKSHIQESSVTEHCAMQTTLTVTEIAIMSIFCFEGKSDSTLQYACT